jgi:hypothetical protein
MLVVVVIAAAAAAEREAQVAYAQPDLCFCVVPAFLSSEETSHHRRLATPLSYSAPPTSVCCRFGPYESARPFFRQWSEIFILPKQSPPMHGQHGPSGQTIIMHCTRSPPSAIRCPCTMPISCKCFPRTTKPLAGRWVQRSALSLNSSHSAANESNTRGTQSEASQV